MVFFKKNPFSFVVFNILILLGVVFQQDYIAFGLAILVYIYIALFVEEKSSVHMMFFLGISTFMFLPSLINWYYLDTDFSLFFVSAFVSVVFLFLTRKTTVKTFVDYGLLIKAIFLISSFIASLLILLGFGGLTTPVFAFLIVLLSLCFQQGQFKNNVVYLSVFICVFFLYSIFYWSGFGRAVVLGWLLLAMLQFAYSINFKVNKYFFGLLPGIGATLLSDRNLFQLKFYGFESALYGSAYQPYRLASSFIDQFNVRGFDFIGLLDQTLFTFFVFIPRAIWPNKPNGFGFEYTVRHLDAYLVKAGHSIASTLIGDHIYFVGYLGIFTSLISSSIIALATNALYRIKGLNGNGVLIFSASMMILVWGGMTSFSARVALPSIVFVLFFVLLRRFMTGKVRIIWGSLN